MDNANHLTWESIFMKTKRAVFISCAILVAALVLGYINTHLEVDNDVELVSATEQNPLKGRDFSLLVNNYSIDKKAHSPYMSMFSELSFAQPCQTISELDKTSEHIVVGTVVSKDYFSYDGNAYTKIDLVLTHVIKGKFREGDKISVIQMGGYISIEDMVSSRDNGFRFADVPQDKWSSTYLWEETEGLPCPEPGQQVLYFLLEWNAFENGLVPCNDYEGVFIDDGKGVFSRYDSSEGYKSKEESLIINSFTLESVLKYFYDSEDVSVN